VGRPACSRYQHLEAALHRTPDEALAYAGGAAERGLKVLIGAAGGAAHLAGVLAAKTQLPVLAVPMPSKHLQGLDSLLAMVQMPAGIPVATFAIGEAGATNGAVPSYAGAERRRWREAVDMRKQRKRCCEDAEV
jgi:5-(carboxyamino)imidazole ribonucleotide mutase